MQMDPIIRSRRKALREAHAWLMARAREMNDPQARNILNSAAFSFGQEMLRGFDRETGKSDFQSKGDLKVSSLPEPPDDPAQKPGGEA